MLELLQYSFFQNAILAAIFTGVTCGIAGTYIVSKRIVFISGGITHTSFGGIGIGYFLGINPLIGAAVFSLLSALGIEYMSKKSEIREDSAIAIMWSFGMAIGIIFIYLTPGYAPNLMSYLFGSILTVSQTEIILIAVLSFIISMFFIIFYKPILYITFDPEFAKTRNLPVDTFNYLLISIIALTIVLSIKVSGIILIISLLTLPQTTAGIFVKNFKSILLISVIIAVTGTIGGLFFAYAMDIPSGAAIIFLLVLLYLAGRGIKLLKL
ncbi:MAG: metal ABC transporter permease [Bacteroidales bacterium]|nr:metal ABC transporter permease [Bacteroidales bacterium]